MTRLRITPLAQADLDEIHDYIARDKPMAAERWVDTALTKFTLLATNPDMGQARDELRPRLRSLSHGNYVIYFRRDPGAGVLEIARVIHAARDVSEITF